MASILDEIFAGYEEYCKSHFIFDLLDLGIYYYFIRRSQAFLAIVELFWTGSWATPTRILFFINRYQVFAWQIFHTFVVRSVLPPFNSKIDLPVLFLGICVLAVSCRLWLHNLIGISGYYSLALRSDPHSSLPPAISVVLLVDLIISLRIYGLYNRARWVATLLGIMLLGTIAGQAYIVAVFSPDFILTPLPFSKNIVVCNPISTDHLYLALLPGLGFDTVVLMLALARGLLHIQRLRGVGARGSNIVHVLTRDSASYFLVILLIYTVLTISWVKLPGVESFTTFGYGYAMISVAGSRMLLNLKRESIPSK
ncbi:hypothetical protein ONZ45_g7519 [Pleurotus djamor]|nr:hypothetical protein ONZ45_g7519 [Pleurotus djamor]